MWYIIISFGLGLIGLGIFAARIFSLASEWPLAAAAFFMAGAFVSAAIVGKVME